MVAPEIPGMRQVGDAYDSFKDYSSNLVLHFHKVEGLARMVRMDAAYCGGTVE